MDYTAGIKVYFEHGEEILTGYITEIDNKAQDASIITMNKGSFVVPYSKINLKKPSSYFNPNPFHLATDISDLTKLIEDQVRGENYRMVLDLLPLLEVKANKLAKRIKEVK